MTVTELANSHLAPVFMNNKACRLIHDRRYDEALSILRRALLVVKDQMEAANSCGVSASTTKHQVQPGTGGNIDWHGTTDTAAITSTSFEDIDADGQGTIDESSSDGSNRSVPMEVENPLKEIVLTDDCSDREGQSQRYIYDEPVVLPVHHAVNDLFFNLCSFALTFNLGLTNHLNAIEADRLGDVEFAKTSKTVARSLYQLSIQIKDTEVLGHHLPSAIFNNIADVCQDQQSVLYYDQILLAVLLVQQGREQHPVTQMYFHKFLSNLSYLMCSGPNVAAAA